MVGDVKTKIMLFIRTYTHTRDKFLLKTLFVQ